MTFQEKLNALQPYLIGIRYLSGMAVVDVVFKEDWVIQESDKIKRVKGNDELNYYMIFSEVEGVGIDDLLGYVDNTIKLNLDREKKHDLLRIKVTELKEVFKKNSLARLSKLKFTFGEEMESKLSDIDEEPEVQPLKPTPAPIIEEFEEEIIKETPEVIQYLDENKNPLPLTDEDREMIAEEARAKQFLAAQKAKKLNGELKRITKPKIELPPRNQSIKQSPVVPNCNCSETQACEKCIEYKDF